MRRDKRSLIGISSLSLTSSLSSTSSTKFTGIGTKKKKFFKNKLRRQSMASYDNDHNASILYQYTRDDLESFMNEKSSVDSTEPQTSNHSRLLEAHPSSYSCSKKIPIEYTESKKKQVPDTSNELRKHEPSSLLTSPEMDNFRSKEFFSVFDPHSTPLHSSLIMHDPSYEILSLLRTNPEYAFVANKAGDLPLHYAAMDKQGINVDVLNELVSLNPKACSQYNSDRSLPLHLHCMIGAPSLEFIKKMLEIHPSSAVVQSELAVVWKEVNQKPSFSDPASSQFCQIFDWTETLKFLTGISLISGKNKNSIKVEVGWSPLHLAVYNGAPIEVIEEIVRVAPQCVHLRTSQNRTALDCGNAILDTIESHQLSIEKSSSEIRMLSLMKQNVLNTKLAVNLLKKIPPKE